MTDTELNEKIARMMGCTLDADGRWWTPYRNTWGGAPPDYLASTRLGELMDLADETLEEWDLQKRHGCYAARRNMDGDTTSWQVEVTASLAFARAIVGHKEPNHEA